MEYSSVNNSFKFSLLHREPFYSNELAKKDSIFFKEVDETINSIFSIALQSLQKSSVSLEKEFYHAVNKIRKFETEHYERLQLLISSDLELPTLVGTLEKLSKIANEQLFSIEDYTDCQENEGGSFFYKSLKALLLFFEIREQEHLVNVVGKLIERDGADSEGIKVFNEKIDNFNVIHSRFVTFNEKIEEFKNETEILITVCDTLDSLKEYSKVLELLLHFEAQCAASSELQSYRMKAYFFTYQYEAITKTKIDELDTGSLILSYSYMFLGDFENAKNVYFEQLKGKIESIHDKLVLSDIFLHFKDYDGCAKLILSLFETSPNLDVSFNLLLKCIHAGSLKLNLIKNEIEEDEYDYAEDEIEEKMTDYEKKENEIWLNLTKFLLILAEKNASHPVLNPDNCLKLTEEILKKHLSNCTSSLFFTCRLEWLILKRGSQDAIEKNLSLVVSNPSSWSWLIVGKYYYRQGDFKQAILAFDECIKLDAPPPLDIPDAYIFKSRALRAINEKEEAAKILASRTAITPFDCDLVEEIKLVVENYK